MIYKCILLLVFYVLYVNGNVQCNQPNNKCICMVIINGYQFLCPNEKSQNVNITVQQKMTNIQCIGEVNSTNQDFRFIETKNVKIDILDCWFVTNNFAKIASIFGINSTKLLTLKMYIESNNFTLTADYFHGLYNLRTLMLHDSNINYISEDAFKSLNDLLELNLGSNINIFLNNDTFKYLRKLKVLELYNNNLLFLPSELFQNLIELKLLQLSSNKLTTLNNSTFDNLRKLELLDLSGNQLNSLPSNIFYELDNLKKIALSKNKLKNIPTDLFTKNPLLEFANLSNNPDLAYLPNTVFRNLTKLQNILLHDCNFSRLPPNLLEGSIHLKNVALQRNKIEVIPETIFNNLAELHSVDLSYNKIQNLSKDVFGSLIQLQTLNIESNFLTHIKEEHFKSLRNLQLVNLKNNKISSIDLQTFERMRNLNTIVLSNNCLNMSMGPVLIHNSELENIDLSHNNITEIDVHFLMKVGLRKLDLSYNKISYIEFSNLMTVSFPIMINLEYNNISTVDFEFAETISRSDGLYYQNVDRKVYLDGNPISCDCYLYDVLRYFDHSIDPRVRNALTIIARNLTCASPKELRNLSISSTEIKPNMIFCNLPQLGIEANYCPKQCFCKYRRYDKTLVVDCIEANLTEVPRLNISTKYFNQLEVHLERNLLTSGPTEHMGYENVIKLFLDDNNISEFTWVPPQVKVLKLNNNNIQHINDKVLRMLNLSSVNYLTLGNNPIACDCSAKALQAYVISQLLSKKIQLDVDNMTCKNNQQFLVDTNEYCPPYKDILIGFGIPIFLAIFVAAILIIAWAKGYNVFKRKHTIDGVPKRCGNI